MMYEEDMKIIQKAYNQNGIEITLKEADLLWSRHSDDYAAGWLILPNNLDDIYQLTKRHFDEILKKNK